MLGEYRESGHRSGQSHHLAADLSPLPALQRLKVLYLGPRVTLVLPAFAEFLRTRCPMLQHLKLRGLYAEPGTWRIVWDAIRHRSSRLTVELADFESHELDVINMTHFTGGESQERFEAENGRMDIVYSLATYLSGLGDWDKTLRIWFDGEEDSDRESVGSVESVDVLEEVDEDIYLTG